MHPEDDTILQLASTVAEALGDQVEVHVDLARAEFARDARALLAAAPCACAGVRSRNPRRCCSMGFHSNRRAT